MKKILITLLFVFLLAGCSSSNVANITNKDQEIWTSPEKTYKSGDLYKSLKVIDSTDTITTSIVKAIAEKEEVDTETINSDLEAQYDDYVEQGYEQYLIYYYGSKESFISSESYAQILNELMKKVAEEEYDDYVDEYAPCKAEIAYFDTKDAAQAVIDGVQSETNTFAYLASENGYASEVSETIITDDADIPVEVKEALQQINGTGLTKIIETSVETQDADGNTTSTPRYYVANVTEKTVDHDEFVEYIVSNYLEQDVVINDYIEKHNVVIHDQDVYDLLVAKYPGVKY